MKKAEKELRIQNLEALGKRLLRQGKTIDAYTIRQALDLFPEYRKKMEEENRNAVSSNT